MSASNNEPRRGIWGPSDTAPKDGVEILCFTKHGDYEISHWDHIVQCWISKRGFFVEPTHWTHLPKPPKRDEQAVAGSRQESEAR